MRKKKQPELTGRDKLLHDLNSIHARLREQVLAAGIQDVHYDAPIKRLEDFTNEQIIDLTTWLAQFEAGPYTAVLAIWNLKPPEWWHNMRTIFSQRKTREEKLLRSAQKRLRQAWRLRHGEPSEATIEDTDSRDLEESSLQPS